MVMCSFPSQIRYAVRQYSRARSFAAAAILTLALGIGVNTAIFTIVQAVLLRPLPYRDPRQLVVVWQTDALHRASGAYFNSYREFEAFEEQSHSFVGLAALTWATESQGTLWEGHPLDVLALPTSSDFFSLLGVQAAMGRTFVAADQNDGCTLVLSYRFWQRKLSAPVNIVGRSITLGKSSCRIVGVMPKSFQFYPSTTDAWSLITPSGDFARRPWQSMVGIFGRLRPGISRTTAEEELSGIQSRVVQEAPPDLAEMRSWRPDVLTLQSNFTWLAGRNLKRGLWLLFASSGLMLLIAAVNVGGLMLSRAIVRAREFAVRAALGSSSAQLLSLSLAEAVTIGTCSAVTGIAIAETLVAWFRSVNPIELPPGTVISLDARVLLFAMASSIATCALLGMLPAWRRSHMNVNEVLKSGGQMPTAAAVRGTEVLAVVQIALSMVLLVAAALVSISFWKLTGVDVGYRTHHLFTARIHLPDRYSDEGSRWRFVDQLDRKLRAFSGVNSSAIGSDFVPRGLNILSVAGQTTSEPPTADVAVQYLTASGFMTLQIPILRGRTFNDADQKDTPPVAVINLALAKRYFGTADPLGHTIKLSQTADPREPWLTIVGVVGNVKTTTVFQEMGYVEPPAVYRPLAQHSSQSLAVMVSALNTPALVTYVQHQLSEIDPTVVLSDVDALNKMRAAELIQPRFRAILLGGFATLALVLSLVGLYGTLSQLVARRTREISIRMALGEDRTRIVIRVLQHASLITGAGVLAGCICAAFGYRFASAMFYGIRAGGAIEVAGCAVVLALLTVAVAAAPAYRAALIDPMRLLRNE